MEHKDYYKGLNLAITVSAKDGEILYQNDSSIEVNGDARGRDLMKCHNERSQQIIRHLLDDAATNVYTISKKGRKKLIYQTPWYEDDDKKIVGGLVEFSIILPEDMHITTEDNKKVRRLAPFFSYITTLTSLPNCKYPER